jgi:dihydroneopterin aldolase
MTHLLHPRLADCRRLFLRDYEVWINIGVHDFEKNRRAARADQRRPVRAAGAVDTGRRQADEVVDYDFIRRSIAERVRAATSTCRKPWPTSAALMLAHPARARRARGHRKARRLPRLRRRGRRGLRHQPGLSRRTITA